MLLDPTDGKHYGNVAYVNNSKIRMNRSENENGGGDRDAGIRASIAGRDSSKSIVAKGTAQPFKSLAVGAIRLIARQFSGGIPFEHGRTF